MLTPVTAPQIDGTPQVGAALIISHGTYSGSVTGYSLQWYCDYGAGYIAISGATNNSFTPGTLEAGRPIKVGEVATGPDGTASENLSLATAPVSTDFFTSGTDVLLSTYTGPLGTWTRNRPTDSATVSIVAATGRARCSSTSSSTVYRLAALPSGITTADYGVEAVIYFAALNMGGVGARTVSNSRSGYYFWYDTGATPGWKITRNDANGAIVGTYGTVNNTLLPGTGVTRRIRLEVTGTGASITLKGWVDGNLLVDTTDSDATRITSIGFPAIYAVRQDAEFDSFSAYPLSVSSDTTGLTSLLPDGCWTWYNSPNSVEHDGITYTGAVTSSGNIVLAKNDGGAITIIPFGAVTQVDDHINPALLVMPSGKLLVAYSVHNGSLFYRLSTNPLPDISAFDTAVTIYASGGSNPANSYANISLMPDGYVRIFSREGAGGVGTNPTRLFKKLASEIEAGSTTWAAPVQQWGITNNRPYPKYAVDSATGRIDVFTSTDHPNEGNASLYHYYILCSGGSEAYYKSDGTPITASLPFDPSAQGTLIMDYTAGNNWTWDVKRASDGTLYAASTKYPGRTGIIARDSIITDIEYWIHRYSGGSWSSYRLSTGQTSLYAAENCYAGGIAIDGADPTLVYASELTGSFNEINLYRVDWSGTPSKTLVRAVTSGSTTNQNRPYSMAGHGLRQAVCWWDGTYTTYSNFSTRVRTVADPALPAPTAPDTTPDAFTFTDQTGVALSTVTTSDQITVAGITSAAAISITGGEYQIDSGAWATASGTINNGQLVRVRHTSSASFSTATNTVLTIGGVSDTFTSTTLATDSTPNAFTFTDQTSVTLSTLVTSNAITVSGINTAATISITGGEYQIDAGSWVTTSGTVTSGQTVKVRHTSSASFSTATNTVLTIGGVSDTFTSTTLAADSTPDAFSFTDQTGVALSTLVTSNTVTISGINTAASISVTGGEYRIGSGSWVTTSGTVTNGQTVTVRHTSSASYATSVNTTLTLGGVSDTFTSTTGSAPAGTTWKPFKPVRQRNLLFEVTLNGPTGMATLHMAKAGVPASGQELNGQHWTPVIIGASEREATFFDVANGAPQPVEISHGSISFALDATLGNQNWSTAYSWEGATAKLYVGFVGDNWSSYRQIFEGSLGPIQRAGQVAEVALLGPESTLAKDLLSTVYQGNGSAEGPSDLKGSLKPWCSGNCQNVEPVRINNSYWVYQVHGYGPINAISAVYEQAVSLGAPASDAPSYAALAALSMAPGTWATCKAEGLFRLANEPSGKITADVQGALDGATYAAGVGSIATHLLKTSGVPPAKIDSASIGAFTQSWGFYTTDQAKVGDVVRSAFFQAGGYLFPSGSAVWQAGSYFPTYSSTTQLPSAMVTSVVQPASAQPAYRVRVGHDQCFSTHSQNEIAQILLESGESIAEVTVFQRAASAPAVPSGGSFDFGTKALTPPAGWSLASPLTGSDPVWMARGTVYTTGTTGTGTPTWAAVGKAFEDGAIGPDGQSLDIVYQRSVTEPTTPAASTGAPTGWYSDPGSIPAGGGLIWASVGERASATSNFVWQTAILVEGQSGQSIAELSAFIRSSSTPAVPTGGSYDFSTKILTPPVGWSVGPPSGTNPCYIVRGTAFINGTSGTTTPSWVVVAKAFEDGATGAAGQSVDIVYQRSVSQPTTPAASAGVPSGWYGDPASVPSGSGVIWASVGERATVGANFVWQAAIQVQGNDAQSIAELSIFIRQATQPSAPTGGSFNFSTKVITPPAGWSVAPPSGTDPCWIARGNAFVTGTAGTATPSWVATGKAFADGAQGPDGQSVDIVYQRSVSQPTTPTASAGVPSGWYAAPNLVPAGSGVIWMSVGERPTASSNYTWQSAVQAQGTDAQSIAEVSVFIRSSSTPAVPSGGSYNFSTKTLTAPASWSVAPPAGTDPCWIARGNAFVTGTTGTATPSWVAVGKAFADGIGTDGQSVDIVYQRATSLPATPAASAGVPSGWYSDPGSVPAGSGVIWMSVGERPTPSSNYAWQTPVQAQGDTGPAGISALTITASPGSVVVACYSNGVPKAALPTVQINVSQGGTDVHAVATYGTPTVSPAGAIGSPTVSSTGAISIGSFTADPASVTVPISYGGATGSVTASYTKTKDGVAATPTFFYTIPSGTPLGTSYSQIASGTVTAGPNGTFEFSSEIDFNTGSVSGSVQSYFEIVVSGVTYGPYASASGSSPPLDSGFAFNSQSVLGSAVGLTSSQAVSVRFWAKRTNGAGMTVTGNNASCSWS